MKGEAAEEKSMMVERHRMRAANWELKMAKRAVNQILSDTTEPAQSGEIFVAFLWKDTLKTGRGT